ncbi:MAG: MBL fold metallo-hydrolase [Myxococcales bacterium]|nr:MBL fold metallo-hydrolase [Myxococcales bacterium]
MDQGDDELHVHGLTLRGVACGGIRTCLMVPELGVMFDAAPRTVGQLKYDTILVSHGHQDHLGGLPYLVSQRHMVQGGAPSVHLPAEVVPPLRRIFDAWREIEDFSIEVDLHGHAPGDTVPLRDGLARCVRSVHRVPSLAWIIERHTRRLRAELQGVPGHELAARRKGGEEITETHVTPLLCVTGDTQIELFDREPLVRRCEVLVHEATGWDDRRGPDDVREWGHTHIDELAERAEQFEGEALVLVHRSPRHTRQQAERIVHQRFPASVRDKVHVFGT